MIIFIITLIVAIIISLIYILWYNNLINRIIKMTIQKYDEYNKDKKTYFCYVDDYFGFKNDIFRCIKVEGKKFTLQGKEYNIEEIKDIKYKLNTLNFNLRDKTYVKIFFNIISDSYCIDSIYLKTYYVISFVLLINIIKKNIDVINKEQLKKLIKETNDKTIKII